MDSMAKLSGALKRSKSGGVRASGMIPKYAYMRDTKAGEDEESRRLKTGSDEEKSEWKFWGPYLADRQWATVREDYSENGDAWGFFPHEHARSRAYRWGEDGLLGFCDEEQRICYGLALWNHKDGILKERLYGLTNAEGNHGEDCKELYYFLDSSPTHSYMHARYKYPQSAYPYEKLLTENGNRNRNDPEFEILDTGVFDNNKYFDVDVKYAKFSPQDILIMTIITNRNEHEAAEIDVIPQLWFRNTWVWGMRHGAYEAEPGNPDKPAMSALTRQGDSYAEVEVRHDEFTDDYVWMAAPAEVQGEGGSATGPEPWFTDNETNYARVFNAPPRYKHCKDAFHEKLIHGKDDAINPERTGTKAGVHYSLKVPAGGKAILRVRLRGQTLSPMTAQQLLNPKLFDMIIDQRRQETDVYYNAIRKAPEMSEDMKIVQRQAYAGLLWTKKFYFYIVNDWLEGDAKTSKPPQSRWNGRNRDWRHFHACDILSMPSGWEYPWFASWDSAFHTVPLSNVDPDFAKDQLSIFLDDRYMHINGAVPAYEWNFSDTNPPVLALALWRNFLEMKSRGQPDYEFLKSLFFKLMLNFTFWTNRKDGNGNNIFGGGFLGLDNIGIFDRSAPLPGGGVLEQADGTAWMGAFSSVMLDMSLELASHDSSFETLAGKFFQHFLSIVEAINFGSTALWDEKDGFYYDEVTLPDGKSIPIKLRSLVGLVPLFASLTVERDTMQKLPEFRRKVAWFLKNRPEFTQNIMFMLNEDSELRTMTGAQFDEEFSDKVDEEHLPVEARFLLSIPNEHQLRRILENMLDENKFLSPFGIRSLSREYENHPFKFNDGHGGEYEVRYLPGESDSGMFGGNSSWRGSIWMPMNYSIIRALYRFNMFYGDRFKIAFPTGSNNMLNLAEVALEISKRLIKIFVKDPNTNERPCHGPFKQRYAADESWRDLVYCYEYFHPETGRGCGSENQTGWTALIANLIDDVAVGESYVKSAKESRDKGVRVSMRMSRP